MLFGRGRTHWWKEVLVIGWAMTALNPASSMERKKANPLGSNHPASPLRLAIAGLVHGHVQGFMESLSNRHDVILVGLSEADSKLGLQFAAAHGIKPSSVYAELGKMLDTVHPQAVAAFTSTFDHLEVVRACASRGVPVMMEKPLAVSNVHAKEMASMAQAGGISLLVNYETTWYPSNQLAFEVVHRQKSIGEIRKIVVHDGHSGPKEIGCPPEFLQWLTDPVLNGAGALFDFGCYGANLATWLMENQRPLSVTAITQQIKPDVYPRVDDEATIVLSYPRAQVIIQASWNWPYGRKDMEIYGTSGYFFSLDRESVRMRQGNNQEQFLTASSLVSPNTDSISYLVSAIQGKIQPLGLSALENNLIVVEILEAARRSAQSGKTVRLEQPVPAGN